MPTAAAQSETDNHEGEMLLHDCQHAKLGEVCVPTTGTRDPRRTPNQHFHYVDISSVDNRMKRVTEAKRLLGSDAPSRARQVIRAKDVLVATTRPNLNAVALVPEELDGEICSTGFCVLRSNGKVEPEFLFAFVQSDLFVRTLSDLVKGALYPAVTDRQVLAQQIPLPPLAEQRRMAVRLREQLAAVAQARAAVQAQSETLDTLSHAVLRESLSNGNTQPVRFADCLREITEGIGDDWHSFPVLGATRAGLAPAKEGVGKNPGRYKPVRAGTIFYNPMRILLGSIAMLDEDDTPGITSPDYVVMTAVEGRLDARWFYQWFRSRYGAEFIKCMTRGAVRERLMFRRLAPTTIVLPDYRRQQTAAAQFAEIKKAKAKLAEQLETLDRLPAALLREAFGKEPMI
ncbi:MAG TPA: restriction endonuclease subunit S [Verrucomicrobiae bacterium]|nr:restriction endonuclease subunit S [Verrucomicrobiae bacterium]